MGSWCLLTRYKHDKTTNQLCSIQFVEQLSMSVETTTVLKHLILKNWENEMNKVKIIFFAEIF